MTFFPFRQVYNLSRFNGQ